MKWCKVTYYYIGCVCVLSCFSHVWLFVTLWTVANQAPPSMGFSRQVYWSGLPWPPPGYLPNPGIEPSSHLSPGLAGRFFTISTIWEATYTGCWFANNHEETQWIPHHLHPFNTRKFSKGYRKESWIGGSSWGEKERRKNASSQFPTFSSFLLVKVHPIDI